MYNISLFLNIFLLLIIFKCINFIVCLSCKNENNKLEDWFIVYKLPKLKHEFKNIRNGNAYAYMTDLSIKSSPGWLLSDYEINNENKSILSKTLRNIYENPEKYSYIQYNDDKPEEENNYLGYAHAKGMIIWNNNDAVWIIHSIPKFSPKFITKKYSYPETGKKYGQNILCITMNSRSNIPKILKQLVTMEAQVYSVNLQFDLNSNFKSLIKKNFDILKSSIIKPNSPLSIKITSKYSENILSNNRLNELTELIKSKKGKEFKSFSKNKRDFVDIYFGMAAISYGVEEMNVKFWKLFQKSVLNSTCTLKEKVKHIKNMKLNFINKPNFKSVEWDNNDHSKWSICNDEYVPCYCAGDMNRATSQMRRGGGLICLLDNKIREVFRKSYFTKTGCNNQIEELI